MGIEAAAEGVGVACLPPACRLPGGRQVRQAWLGAAARGGICFRWNK